MPNNNSAAASSQAASTGNTSRKSSLPKPTKNTKSKDVILQELTRTKMGSIRKSISNCKLIILYDSNIPELSYCEFTDRVSIGKVFLTDERLAELRIFIDEEYEIEFTTANVSDVCKVLAAKTKVNPVVEYLDSLTWDGKPRLGTLLIDCAGAHDDIFTREATSKALIAAVERAYFPGSKFDYLLVIGGQQGLGKSRLIRALCPVESWFSDTALPVGKKDALQQLTGRWIYEVAELDSLKDSKAAVVKGFISSQFDKFRPANAKSVSENPRRLIFIGTVNGDSYLSDPTGNRRYWPVHINKQVDVAYVEAERDQLWAEAVVRYKKGELTYLSSAAEAIATILQESKRDADDRELDIESYINTLPASITKISSAEIGREVFDVRNKAFTRNLQILIAGVMTRLGWTKKPLKIKGSTCQGYTR